MGEGRFFSTDMVSLAGRGFRRHGSGRRSGEIGGWKSEIGNRKSEIGGRGSVYGTEHWCLASEGSRRSECNVLGSEHHAERDGYQPTVASRLKDDTRAVGERRKGTVYRGQVSVFGVRLQGTVRRRRSVGGVRGNRDEVGTRRAE